MSGNACIPRQLRRTCNGPTFGPTSSACGCRGTAGVNLIAGDVGRLPLRVYVHYLLIYDAAADYLERRAAFRAEHLALARAAQARGELVLGGAFADPVDGAAILFRGDSPAAAEAFAEADPYVRNGLVTRWRVRPWTTVIGEDAECPLPANGITPRPCGPATPRA